MASEPTRESLQAALTLNQTCAWALKKQMFLRMLLTTGWVFPLALVCLFFAPRSVNMWALPLIYFGMLVTMMPSPAVVAASRPFAAVEKLTAELRHALFDVKNEEEQSALWAELAMRLAKAHGAAFAAPTLSGADQRRGATLAASRALEDTLLLIPRFQQSPSWAGWERTISLAVGVPVGLFLLGLAHLIVVPLGLGAAWFLIALFIGNVVAHTFRALRDTPLRRAAQQAILERQADTLRAFLNSAEDSSDEDGAALMDRWLTLRAQHETQLGGWPSLFGGSKGP